ncbi:hypothetical protein QOZ80_2BG0173420 [Eleusine coracana subsp. coracana]|nr:hypothetical protein QOZ80_2BG0173420 [Eleusine coracana subsp. coracana]
MAYYGVGTNLVSYLTKVQQQSNVTAASNIASWQGLCYLSPLLGAFLADSYWGRYRTIVISLAIFTVGMALLTLSSLVPASIHLFMISLNGVLPSMGLFLTALGLGGIWPCVPTFGADQFDETNGAEKLQKVVYYNWYYFAVNGGFFIASTILVWIQDYFGWVLGFGIPTLFSAIGVAGFLASMKLYMYQRPGGSAYTRICQVIVAATRKANVDVPMDSSVLYENPGKESAIVGSRKLIHTDGLKFLDRAATITASDEVTPDRTNPWKLCTVTQVEELKILTRIMPVLLTGIIFNTAEALFPLFIEQGEIMDNLIVVTVGRGSNGWIPENLNEGHLDLFFWLMSGLQLLNLLIFMYCAMKYKRKLAT